MQKIEIFSIVGCGRVGRALAIQLSAAGYEIAGMVDTDQRRAESLQVDCGGYAVSTLEQLDPRTTFILIAVPDDVIAGVGNALAHWDGLSSGLCVAHTSGLLDSKVLKELRERGAGVVSCHPAFSFSEITPPSLEGVPFAIEGDGVALRRTETWIKRLGGVPWIIRMEDKVRYHTACAMASNDLVALMKQVEALMDFPKGDGLQTLMPLIEGTLDNIKVHGTDMALTGAILRGDALTVHAHLKALADLDRLILNTYLCMGRAVLRMAEDSGLDSRKASLIREAFNAFDIPAGMG